MSRYAKVLDDVLASRLGVFLVKSIDEFREKHLILLEGVLIELLMTLPPFTVPLYNDRKPVDRIADLCNWFILDEI